MAYDELELDRIGDRKTAVFFIISDTTQTYNFLVALAFSQMFNLLCERADNVHGGRLPHHVRVLWDEAANTGQVPQLEKIVAVIRSREISLTLFYQQLAQCKAIYDKHAETILGNMDSVIFLGGREASTIKEISENWLGKATISMQTDSRSRGQSESYSQNNQRLGRELMTPSELATMPGDIPIVMLTALDAEENQIKGLDLEADDYITKPFSMSVLIRKIAAILRRSSQQEDMPHTISYRDLTLDLDGYKVYTTAGPIDLTPREFEILRELLTHKGRILTRQNLLQTLWKYEFFGDERIIDTHIKNLRKKLGQADYIETIRGVGYRIDKED